MDLAARAKLMKVVETTFTVISSLAPLPLRLALIPVRAMMLRVVVPLFAERLRSVDPIGDAPEHLKKTLSDLFDFAFSYFGDQSKLVEMLRQLAQVAINEGFDLIWDAFQAAPDVPDAPVDPLEPPAPTPVPAPDQGGVTFRSNRADSVFRTETALTGVTTKLTAMVAG